MASISVKRGSPSTPQAEAASSCGSRRVIVYAWALNILIRLRASRVGSLENNFTNAIAQSRVLVSEVAVTTSYDIESYLERTSGREERSGLRTKPSVCG